MAFKSYPRVFFELLIIGFAIVLGQGLAQSFLPIFAKELDPSGIIAGFVVSAWFLSRVFIEIPSGIISDRIGRSRLLVVGISLSASGAFLCAISNSIYMLIIGRGIWGLGTALYFMNNSALIMDLFDPSVRGRTLGTFQSIELIGSFIGAPFGAFIAENIGNSIVRGYNLVFYLSFGLILAAFTLAFMSKEIRHVSTVKTTKSTVSLKEVFLLFGNTGVAVICICSFSRMLIMQGITNTVLELYLNEGIMLSVSLIGIVLSFRSVGFIISSISSGYLSDRIGRKPIIIVGILIGSASMLILANVSSFELFMLTALMMGLGEGMVFTCLLVLLSEVVSPHVRGGAIGLYRTFMDLGGFIGPILFAFMYDNLGPSFPFYSAAAILLFNAILVISIRKMKLVTQKGSTEAFHH